MFGLGKTLTFIICILGWLKSDLGVVLLCFSFDWKISGEKEETTPSGKSDSLRLSVGALA